MATHSKIRSLVPFARNIFPGLLVALVVLAGPGCHGLRPER
jgi:hypothetical protein